MADKALEAKNKGNAAFSSGDFQTAIKHFTEAISYDPNNHVLYSNRSAAYASLNKYEEALTDANKTVEIKPDWSKGYGRKGAALHGLQRLEEAIDAYDKGIELEPNNALLKKGRDDVENALTRASGDIFGNLLKGDILGKLRSNPKTAAYCFQPDFIQIVNTIQKNPQTMTQYMADPRVSAMLSVLLGIDFSAAPPSASAGGAEPMETEPAPKPTPKKEEPPKPKEPEKELPENKKQALQEKEKGTEAYKKKDFETALKHYTNAIELDPEDMVYRTNRAAVYFETKKYDETVQDCKEAIEVGRKHFADFKLVARAFGRLGNAYAKQEKYAEAIDAYNRSLTEHRTPDVLDALHKTEKLKKEKEQRDYINPEISLQEKEKGNEFFKKNLYPEAVKAYTEAIKRNPTDHTLYSNRAGAYAKLGEFPLAVKDADECIALKPDFVKAYIRKGNAHYFMKDYHKSLEAYEKGLKLDENNAELKEGLKKTMYAINAGNYAGDEKEQQERAAKAAQDPEIQNILRDPVMVQILNDMQTDPKAVANHMRNPAVAAKINKLIAAGILRTG
jgi:stress-induced-phosphoprotein 1